jgi:hypothetical protein
MAVQILTKSYKREVDGERDEMKNRSHEDNDRIFISKFVLGDHGVATEL